MTGPGTGWESRTRLDDWVEVSSGSALEAVILRDRVRDPATLFMPSDLEIQRVRWRLEADQRELRYRWAFSAGRDRAFCRMFAAKKRVHKRRTLRFERAHHLNSGRIAAVGLDLYLRILALDPVSLSIPWPIVSHPGDVATGANDGCDQVLC